MVEFNNCLIISAKMHAKYLIIKIADDKIDMTYLQTKFYYIKCIGDLLYQVDS